MASELLQPLTFSGKLDVWLDEYSDRFNPILVKETRQALKSRQFVITFFLMLAAAWFMATFGVVQLGTELEYLDAGGAFFRFFYMILIFGLCIVVPVGVFRAMTAEFVHETIDTLTVTPLTPGRIVFGKLQSAVVQMAIYYSAIAPFLAFTYLLRGIGLVEIFFLLFISLLASSFVCLFAIMFGSLAKKSFWESLCLLGVLGIGIITFLMTSGFASMPLENIGAVAIGLFCVGVGYLYCMLLTIGIATAQMTPAYTTGSPMPPHIRPYPPRATKITSFDPPNNDSPSEEK